MKKSAKFLSEQPSEEDIDHSEFDLTHRLGPTYDSLSHCRDKSICFGVRSMSIKCSIDYRYPFFLPPIMICWDVSSKSRKVRAPITKVSCSHDEIDELKAILPYKKKINETDAETLWQKRLAKFDSTTCNACMENSESFVEAISVSGKYIYIATSLCLSEQMKSEVRGWRVGVCNIVSCGTRG